MNESTDRTFSRWCGWAGLLLFVGMWVQLALMPFVGALIKGFFGRIFPQQIFIQFLASLILTTVAGLTGRKRWLIVSVAALLSITLFIAGLVLD